MLFVCRINTMQCLKISSLCLFGGKLGPSMNLSFKLHTHKLYIIRRCTIIIYTLL